MSSQRELRQGRLCVECRPHAGGDVPVRFGYGGTLREVEEVIDRWLGADYRYFRVRTREADTFILRYDERSATWQISVYEAAGFDAGRIADDDRDDTRRS